ncbi:MAG TPA: hypothetical protein H9837_08545 [Candidatus Brachybacterium merdigallinarum]|nr:hypothetical protein [Candidatus Brachybacterium merdigallinarum]
MSRTTIASTLRRRAAGVLAIGAAAALVAGCSSGSSGAPAPDDLETQQEETADDTAEEPSDGGGDSTEDSGQDGEGTEGGQDDGQDDSEDAEEPEGDGPEVPQEWAGTVSAETLPDQGGTSYIALNHFNTEEGVTALTAEEIEGVEFAVSYSPECEGTAEIDGAAATCTLVNDEGETVHALVHLVPTGFGNTALMFGVNDQAMPEYTVAPGAEVGIQSLAEGGHADVTAETMADAAMGAVMMGDRNDGDLPESLEITCEVSDEGQHGLCEVTGTPEGGGDGTWYATAQNGFDGDVPAYLFTRLP